MRYKMRLHTVLPQLMVSALLVCQQCGGEPDDASAAAETTAAAVATNALEWPYSRSGCEACRFGTEDHLEIPTGYYQTHRFCSLNGMLGSWYSPYREKAWIVESSVNTRGRGSLVYDDPDRGALCALIRSTDGYTTNMQWRIKPVEPSNRLPIGNLDGASADGAIWGCAYDPDTLGSHVRVSIYVDGGLAKALLTTTDRADVDAKVGSTGPYGFVFRLGASDPLMDGQRHMVEARAIDVNYWYGEPSLGSVAVYFNNTRATAVTSASSSSTASAITGLFRVGVGGYVGNSDKTYCLINDGQQLDQCGYPQARYDEAPQYTTAQLQARGMKYTQICVCRRRTCRCCDAARPTSHAGATGRMVYERMRTIVRVSRAGDEYRRLDSGQREGDVRRRRGSCGSRNHLVGQRWAQLGL